MEREVHYKDRTARGRPSKWRIGVKWFGSIVSIYQRCNQNAQKITQEDDHWRKTGSQQTSSEGKEKDRHREAHLRVTGWPRGTKWKKQESAERIIEHQGQLCRQWHPRDRSEEVIDHVVLPLSYRLDILQLTHNVPMVGHLGWEHTAKQILKWFLLPGVFQDIRKYCKSCNACQRVAKKREKLPLILTPIIDAVAEALQIVGSKSNQDKSVPSIDRWISWTLQPDTKVNA